MLGDSTSEDNVMDRAVNTCSQRQRSNDPITCALGAQDVMGDVDHEKEVNIECATRECVSSPKRPAAGMSHRGLAPKKEASRRCCALS